MEDWNNPSKIWPPVIPRSMPRNNRGIINEVEAEEFTRLKILKDFEFPNFQVGDIVKFHYLHSISEGRGNTYTGLVISKLTYFLFNF